MKVEYTNRAIADLQKIAENSLAFGDAVALALEARINKVIERIADLPGSGATVAGRSDIHVIPLIRYPYLIFYRVLSDRVRILHIRHTARRPWRG